MASYVVALRIAPTQLVALLDLWCIIITISHGARIKRIVSLICRVSSMSHHITSHLIACRSAARRTTAVCRAARCMSHLITSRVSEPLWGSATRCCAPVLGRANPCGGCGVYPCGGNWDERTLCGGCGVYGVWGQLSQVSETAATLAELWEGSLESCECRAKDKPVQELDCARC